MSSGFVIDRAIHSKKTDLLSYLRQRATEHLVEIQKKYGQSQFRQRSRAINQAIAKEREQLTAIVRQQSIREGWSNLETLRAALLIMHSTNVVMIENRNQQWPYEYMAFSRRIGELWEPFCDLCFEFPVRGDVVRFIPPLFRDVRDRLGREVSSFIRDLAINEEEKQSLLRYYDQVWQLVTSGEINLELDLHIETDSTRYVIDVKSGFGSNEKGNTNRLLLVASVYLNIEPENYECLLLVRTPEDENNNYLQTLKNSDLWNVYCGTEAYVKLEQLSGFNLGDWIADYVSWENDINQVTWDHLERNELSKYLIW